MLKKTLLVPTQTIGNFELWSVFTKIKKETFVADDESLRVTVGYKIKQNADYSHKIQGYIHLQHDGSPYTLEDEEAFSYLKMKNKQHIAINLLAKAYDDLDPGDIRHKEQAGGLFDFLDFEIVGESVEVEQVKEETEETKAQNLLTALRAALR